MSETDNWNIQDSPPQAAARSSASNSNITSLGFGSTIEGQLILAEDSVINGAIKGDIKSTGSLTVGDSATIQGNISGEDIKVYGTVNGNISSNRVELLAGASLNGDVQCQCLIINEGVQFEGRSAMEEDLVEASIGSVNIVESTAP